MRIHAYVLAGDPDYLAASIASYYPIVDRIVLSADAQDRGWSGLDLPVEECIVQARAADPEGKVVIVRGDFQRAEDDHLMDSETRQRRHALAAASEGADWVLQLDGDEVLPRLPVFVEMLDRADAAAAQGLDFPSRWLYAALPDGRFMETSSRFWQEVSGYPGSLAVRAGATLEHARQVDGPLFRVDVRARNTDIHRPASARVDAVIAPDDRVLHFSMTRTLEVMRRKARISGHASDFDWESRISGWVAAQRHPRLRVATTPLRRRKDHGWLKLTTLPISTPPVRV